MQQISISEINNNFPDFAQRFYKKKEPVVVTEYSQPHFVVVPWALFQEQQLNNEIAARVQLKPIVTEMLQTVGGLQEAYEPDSLDHKYEVQHLQSLAHRCWKLTQSMKDPYLFLAIIISDSLQDILERDEPLSLEQLAHLTEIIPLFNSETLTQEQVSSADLSLLDVGLNSLLPPLGEFAPGEIAALFERS